MQKDQSEDDSMSYDDSPTCSLDQDETIDASNETSMDVSLDDSDTLLSTSKRSVSEFFNVSKSLDSLAPPTPIAISHSEPTFCYEEEGSPYRPPTKSLRTQSMKFASAVTREQDTHQNFLGPHRNEHRPFGVSLSTTMQRGESMENLSPYGDDSRFGKLLANTRRTGPSN